MLTKDIDCLFFGFNNSLNKLVSQLYQSRLPLKHPNNYPPINYKLNKKNGSAIVQYALAGFKKQDIDVCVKNNTLIISIKKTRSVNASDVQDIEVLHNGIAKRSISQQIACTEDYQAQKAVISFQDGILRIQIPQIERNIKHLTIN